MLNDSVFINRLAATAIIGKDAWNRPTPQPISVLVALSTDFRHASATDNLKYSLNYAVMLRHVLEYLRQHEHHNFKSLANIGERVSDLLCTTNPAAIDYHARVSVESAKSEIRASLVEYVLHRTRAGAPVAGRPDQYRVNALRLLTIIGVFTFERLQRQIVDIDLTIDLVPGQDAVIHEVIDECVRYVEASNFKTVETLVRKIGQLVLQGRERVVAHVDVRVTKPNAISFTEGVGVTLAMSGAEFEGAAPVEIPNATAAAAAAAAATGAGAAAAAATGAATLMYTSADDSHIAAGRHTAYIAFGSNEGNAVKHITRALALLASAGVAVVATSSMYISKPMYETSQRDFYNGAVKVEFDAYSPHELLAVLKRIEYEELGRVKHSPNGPRTIDLDILLYDDVVLSTADLNIPHILMLERTFVLQPLAELCPPDMLHPVSAEPIHLHLSQLWRSSPESAVQESPRLLRVVPAPRAPMVFDPLRSSRPTVVMGVLNVTPDSFSDGGAYGSPEEVVARARQMAADGATVLDIGGASTRPGAPQPSLQEELARVLPVVQAIRRTAALEAVLLSIDTYRAEVAAQCLAAGADIINDVSMGSQQMFAVVARHGCPYILNHTRGTPQTMGAHTAYAANTNEDIVEYFEARETPATTNLVCGVSRELALQMLKAFAAGVRKWQLIVDPGIGFAKDLAQNLHLIRHAAFFKDYSVLVNARRDGALVHSYVSLQGLPTLMGPSRKKFLGTLCGEPVASERVVSTGAAVMACIAQRADMVRVHDVKEIKKVCAVGDAIYRDVY